MHNRPAIKAIINKDKRNRTSIVTSILEPTTKQQIIEGILKARAERPQFLVRMKVRQQQGIESLVSALYFSKSNSVLAK